MQHEGKEYIRVFQDSTPEDLWNSYCRACGITNPSTVKSFRIYYDKDIDIEVDEYNSDGSLKTL